MQRYEKKLILAKPYSTNIAKKIIFLLHISKIIAIFALDL
jgi:hypothetical protein